MQAPTAAACAGESLIAQGGNVLIHVTIFADSNEACAVVEHADRHRRAGAEDGYEYHWWTFEGSASLLLARDGVTRGGSQQ